MSERAPDSHQGDQQSANTAATAPIDDPTEATNQGDNASPTDSETAPPAEPSREKLTEPSVEKQPEEQPKADHEDVPEPSHRAVGIGVVPTAEPDDASTQPNN